MRKRTQRKPQHHRRLKMSHAPWKVQMVFDPIEKILHRMQSDGTIDCAQGRPVFREDGRGGWYDLVAALRGVIEFHQLAEARHGIPADVDGMIKLANKLHASAPIFEEDIATTRANIETCKRQALRLTIDEATDIVRTIQIGMEMDKIKPAPAANSERSRQAAGNSQGAGDRQMECKRAA